MVEFARFEKHDPDYETLPQDKIFTRMSTLHPMRTLLALSIILALIWAPHSVQSESLPPIKPSEITPNSEQGIPPASPKGDQYLVKISPGWSIDDLQAIFSENGFATIRKIPGIEVWLLSGISSSTDRQAPKALTRHAGVQWVETNGLVRASGVIPDDVFYLPQQDSLRVIRLPEAWSFTTGGEAPIAIIDTGIDMDHIDLKGKLWHNSGEIPNNGLDDDTNGYIDDIHGWDFVNLDPWPQDDHSHGSHVAGIAAADSDNTSGIAGVSWGARIMALKALNSQGEGSFADLAAAIVYAVDHGARVINLSLGSINPSQTVEAAVDYAVSQGVMVIAAAGNGGAAVEYPAAYPQVVAVAATDNDDQAWSLSNYGPQVEVAAPGVDIFSANRQGFYYFSTGTSMSAAHVSGLASLIWSLKPNMTADQIRNVLTSTTRDVWTPGFDERTGWGRIDAQNAVFSIVNPEIQLSATASIIKPQETAQITASVSSPELAIHPQDLSVHFTSNIGSLTPQIGLTQQGVVTTTFQSSQPGYAIITANIGSGYTQSIEINVAPYTLYLLNIINGVPLLPR